ncbi:hypothetical protein SAMN05216197_12153 [Pseudomonas graminis]|uniref:DUF1534 domain-containing protein n=1 Tax=Pseudomonas graminis TaxID=158627 RepID=A0A1I0GGU1_9PSED|nr:hypothetical protein SAMN05216197_12153 [Pseudomonas graminis]
MQHTHCGTGFSREGVRRHSAKSRVLIRASSRLKPVPLKSSAPGPAKSARLALLTQHTHCGTGFSREGVRRHAAKSRVLIRASSRLKPVPLKSSAPGRTKAARLALLAQRTHFVAPALAGKGPVAQIQSVSGARRRAARRAFHRAGWRPATRCCRWCRRAARLRQGRSRSGPAPGTHE